jgi:hypothetical protein
VIALLQQAFDKENLTEAKQLTIRLIYLETLLKEVLKKSKAE